jgi:hypothetical protein
MVTLLFMVCVLALLVATVANDSLQTLKTVSQSGRDTQAKYAAYAGMEMVMNKLRQQPRYIGEETLGENHGRTTDNLTELNRVSYDVLIWNNMREESAGGGSGADRDPIDGPDGVVVQADTVYMVSTGTDTVRGEDVLLTSLAGTARRIRPVFEDAAYARTKMVLLGHTLVDAWDSGGGWTKYVGGSFPGEVTGGGSSTGGPGPPPTPTVEDYEATLGTDSGAGRTLRMLGDSRLNGYYRIGPGVSDEGAFSSDSGSTGTTTSPFGGGSVTTTFGVATAVSPATQIAGVETEPEGYYKLDDKSTEMPRFTSPYDSDDLLPAPVVANPSTTRTETDRAGHEVEVHVPPAPVAVVPGGYERIDVPANQTLQLSPGVYYFSEEMKVEGKVELTGSDPVIIFVGKKAVFDNAEINHEGKTSSLQLCFTDELKDDDEISSLVGALQDYFELPSAPSDSAATTTTATGDGTATAPAPPPDTDNLPAYIRSILSPVVDPSLPADDPNAREGASVLEMNGGEFYGSVSGKNLVVLGNGGDIYGSMMANVVKSQGTNIHQDLALKGSNLMNAGGWALEGVHQVR